MVWDTTAKSSMLKFLSSGGVGSLDRDRRPWLDPPWSDELSDNRLGPRPRSSPLTDREWAVLLSLFVVGGRLRKSRTAPLVSRGLLPGLTLVGRGRRGGVLGPSMLKFLSSGANVNVKVPQLLGLPDGRRRTPRTPHQVLPLRPARALSSCVFSPRPGLGGRWAQ